MQEWQKEFGRNTYFLADSFNEMELPENKGGAEARNNMLSSLGEQIYRSISSTNRMRYGSCRDGCSDTSAISGTQIP